MICLRSQARPNSEEERRKEEKKVGIGGEEKRLIGCTLFSLRCQHHDDDGFL